MLRVDVSADMLQWAQSRAGLAPGALATRIPQLPDWDAGTTRPTLKQLERFAKATHTPLGFLFLPAPPVENFPIPDLRTVGSSRRPLVSGAPRRRAKSPHQPLRHVDCRRRLRRRAQRRDRGLQLPQVLAAPPTHQDVQQHAESLPCAKPAVKIVAGEGGDLSAGQHVGSLVFAALGGGAAISPRR